MSAKRDFSHGADSSEPTPNQLFAKGVPSKREQALLQKRAELDAQLKRAQQQARKKWRQEETRRKIIVGALLISEAEDDAELRERIYHLLNTKVTRQHDRVLFDLPPLSGQDDGPG